MNYYTPSPEEFHIGFEYEQWNKDKQNFEKVVAKTVFYIQNAVVLLKEVSMRGSLVRVKYLDEQDIIDLGWKKEERSYTYKDSDHFHYELTLDEDRELILTKSHYKVNLKKWTFYTVFMGQLKNKSELKRLMKQLGI